ncbi:nucleoside deaminase [Limnovirga soli]|uniref:tRNA-specific adenosine deaminase n=1 Tax=Limnovirga soli TaxID=2656915 RepID=A0A8J8JTQ1_9BACT|nr:nucleoside deaminase [Limnovirga soli]NNV54829.1 tRNA-specific adenosine deaminase [Limnovirga soli]
MTREEIFMQQAIAVGLEGMRAGKGGPFGCVIVQNNQIIASGCNTVLATNDPTAHAEVVAIRQACAYLQSFQLTGCELYASCEPCPMCMGAIYWARPDKVYFANTKADAAAIGFDDAFIYEEMARPMHLRKLSMQCLDSTNAIEMFAEWQEKGNKTLY